MRNNEGQGKEKEMIGTMKEKGVSPVTYDVICNDCRGVVRQVEDKIMSYGGGMHETCGRTFNAMRREQGFKSQEHIDAFYAFMDHRKGCKACSSVAGYVWHADGEQPYEGRCEEGKRLDAASLAY
jgi:hypothetical protein